MPCKGAEREGRSRAPPDDFPECSRYGKYVASFAVNSLVERHHVLTASFQASLTGTTPRGEIIARGRFVGMSGKKYLAESMLTDADGREIGRGEGAFIVSNIPLGSPLADQEVRK